MVQSAFGVDLVLEMKLLDHFIQLIVQTHFEPWRINPKMVPTARFNKCPCAHLSRAKGYGNFW